MKIFPTANSVAVIAVLKIMKAQASVDRPCKLQAVATVAIARIHQLCISLCYTFYTSLPNVFEHALSYIVTS